jgi:L-fuconolactonase
MKMIDAQIHVYEQQPSQGHQLATSPNPGTHGVTGEVVIDLLDSVGVNGAILMSAYGHYGYDPSYALSVAERYPERFTVIAPVDPCRPDIGEFTRHWSQLELTVGLRVLLGKVPQGAIDAGSCDKFFATAEATATPICVFWPRHEAAIGAIAAQYPGLQLVVDHLGLDVYFTSPPDLDRLERLPAVLELAQHENVAIKITATPSLSLSAYPYDDVWPALHSIFTRFGLDRAMWGTDWTRVSGISSYKQSVSAFTQTRELSGQELQQLMGGTAQRIFGWTPAGLIMSSSG